MHVKDQESSKLEDTLTPERKDELGNMIYEAKLNPADMQELSLEELGFLLATHALYNRESPLPNFEANHRVIYNDLLRRVHEATELFVLYDKKTGYPLLDGGCVLVYLDKEHAEKASEVYNTQFRQTVVISRPGENAEPVNGQKPLAFFDYLYYLGTENVMIDNGYYKAAIKRSEIAAPIGFNEDPSKQAPSSPALAFGMTDFIQEASWAVNYEIREEVLKRKQERMFALLGRSKFILPLQVFPVEGAVSPEGKPQSEIKFPIMSANDKKFIPVFTDMFEYSKNLKDAKTYKPAGFDYGNVVKFMAGVDGIIINPLGQKIILGKEQAEKLLEVLTQNN